ncbi:MAG TPA: MBL fold metallo-hydrolase [Steroidobacteraceae bacterium]|nr:MBL fold metallo-hydrolase [Steroidobacteraceae bacterium]
MRAIVSSALIGLLPLAGLAAAPASPPPAAAPDFSQVQIRVTRVTGDLYALEGQGGTVSVLAGPDGALVIDSQFAPLSEKLIAAIRTFSQARLRFLLNTHVHGDHTGGNANFTRAGATVIARDNVRQRMRFPAPNANGTPGTPAVAEALPVVTFEGPTAVYLNGQTVRMTPMPAAHTDGDVMIEFPQLDVLVVGDFFRSVGYPVADRNSGGSFRGIVDALGIAIGRAGAATRVIPGHGPISSRAGLIEQRDLLVAIIDSVEKLVRSGQTVEQVLAAKPTAAFDDRVPQGAQSAERLIRGLYAELSAEKR